jgi:putative ABC transport system permease protein
MIAHLFRLIWNKKKQNFLLMTEMLISFLVLFAVFTLLVFYYRNYKKPMGFEYENVWVANYSNGFKSASTDSLDQFYESLRQSIKSLPEVRGISFSSENIPLSQNTSQGGINFNGQEIRGIDWYTVEDSYLQVMGMKMLSGRWYNRQDDVAANRPIVINASLKEKLFGPGEAVGKLIGDGDGQHKMKVIGVVEDIKAKGDYAPPGIAIFNRIDTGAFRWLGRILIRVIPNADAAFESRLYKTMSNSMKNSNVEIEHLTNKRKSINYFTLVPMIVLLIVAGFLIINVALGLYGVLWYNINKRKGEIGLRRAVGASGISVTAQLIGEAMILATISLVIGCFFAFQFPLLNVFDLDASTYIMAIFLSVLFIYTMVLICSLYPGKQAAAIYPAVALHED